MNSTKRNMKLELLSLNVKKFKESVLGLADKAENVEDFTTAVTKLENGIDYIARIDYLVSEFEDLKKSIDTLCKIMIDQNNKKEGVECIN